MRSALTEKLEQAVRDLEYPSEEDAPFDVIAWPATAGISALDALKSHAEGKIEQVAIGLFFAELADTSDARRFAELRRTLEENLKNPCIYRVVGNTAMVDIYLLGQSAAGEWAGVHTTSVET